MYINFAVLFHDQMSWDLWRVSLIIEQFIVCSHCMRLNLNKCGTNVNQTDMNLREL